MTKILTTFFMIMVIHIAWAESTTPEREVELRRLIHQLGSDTFKERKQAEIQLKAEPRAALDTLRAMLSETDDPEIRMRLQKVITHIISDPSKIPKVYHALKVTKRGEYAPLANDFLKKASITARNTKGNMVSVSGFAQSFIPNCRTVSAIEICTYPLQSSFGWMRLDLCDDKNGAPGSILARSWVWIPKQHHFPSNYYIYHDIPDQAVNPTDTYWFVYNNFPDSGSKRTTLINYIRSAGHDAYPDGMHWSEGARKPSSLEDVKFRIFESSAVSHPGYRKASKEELKTLPSPEKQKKTAAVFKR